MDAHHVTTGEFWDDPRAVSAGGTELPIPSIPDFGGHVLFETSGSTGTPKWIALSKDALRVSATAVNHHLAVTPVDCWGLALPLRHVGGFGVAARAHVAGCRFEHFTPRWNAAAFSAWLDRHQVTLTSLVPTQVHDLVTAKQRAPDCLRAIVVGGGRLDETTGRAARGLGWPVLASYGMTEAASQIATQPLESLHDIYQSSPIPLLPIWRAEVSGDGRLKIAGPALFSGMLVKTTGVWHYLHRDDEWFTTEDRVAIDGGWLTPLGRTDTRIKVLGELVDPADIERALSERSGGRLPPGSVVVVPLPDERTGHALVPVFDAAADRATVHAVLAGYEAVAAGPWRLRPPVYLADFPRSALGKPLRAEIAAVVVEKSPM